MIRLITDCIKIWMGFDIMVFEVILSLNKISLIMHDEKMHFMPE